MFLLECIFYQFKCVFRSVIFYQLKCVIEEEFSINWKFYWSVILYLLKCFFFWFLGGAAFCSRTSWASRRCRPSWPPRNSWRRSTPSSQTSTNSPRWVTTAPGNIKVAATSLKLEVRLYAHQLGTSTRSGSEVIFTLILIGSCVRN